MKKVMDFVCIKCPIGCQLHVEVEGENVSVSGNRCPRGEEYAMEEVFAPRRMVTSLIRTDEGVVSVKTTAAVPKDMIFKVLNQIGKIALPSAKINDVVIENVLGLGVDVVVTKNSIKDNAMLD